MTGSTASTPGSPRPVLVGGLVYGIAAAIGIWAIIRSEPGPALLTPFVLLACLLIVVGEQLTIVMERRVLAPMATAAALGLALTPLGPDGERATATTVLAVVWLSTLAGAALAKLRVGAITEGPIAARFLGVATATLLARGVPVGPDGGSLLDVAFAAARHPVTTALMLLGVAAVGLIVERAVETAVAWQVGGLPWRALLADEGGTVGGLSVATAFSGPLTALAYPVLGWAALPCFLLPVVLVFYTVRRVAAIRVAQAESIEAMARLGEVAGVSAVGHTHRVAGMATRVARTMQLDETGVRRVERAALLHDVGRLALDGPPVGGGVTAGERDRWQMAAAEEAILGGAEPLSESAQIVAAAHTPFRQYRELGEEIPLEARIVRVASAWDDITEGARTPHTEAVALERLHLGLGYEYDPAVVDAIEASLGDRRVRGSSP